MSLIKMGDASNFQTFIQNMKDSLVWKKYLKKLNSEAIVY